MRGWRCERCSFTHIDEAPRRLPKRCPLCGSTRIRMMPPQASERLKDEGGFEEPSREIYRILGRLGWMSVQEQESTRRRLREMGVHILCMDDRRGRLGVILTRGEAESYLSLIREQGFGLAVIGQVVVAVAPDSPIRPHVGVNPGKLKELLEASGHP